MNCPRCHDHARLMQTPSGKMLLKVFYDPATKDWDEQIELALRHYRLDRKAVTVICEPRKGATTNG